MTKILSLLKKISIGAFLVFLIWLFAFNWSFVFKRKVIGEIVAAERVVGAMAIITQPQNSINPQAFSFSIGIKDRTSGEIFMASSEDRKWAAVSKGNCVVAAFFPYPPWQLSKGMTDHNARLLKNYVTCNDMAEDDGFLEKIRFFFLAF
jgi:hypothetical protein